MSGFAISIYLPKKLNDQLLSELNNLIENKYKGIPQKLNFKNRKKIKERLLISKWEIIFQLERIVVEVDYEEINKDFPFNEETEFEYLQLKEYFNDFPDGILTITSGINISRDYPEETYNLITEFAEITGGYVYIDNELSYLIDKKIKGQKIEIMVVYFQGTGIHNLLNAEFLKDWKNNEKFKYLF
jgi:hypothetical protein